MVARSDNLLDWSEIRYQDFPEVTWADNGPTAPMVLDRKAHLGCWLMVFHGDRVARNAHGGALGLAWSRDLTPLDAAWREILIPWECRQSAELSRRLS